MFETMKKIVLLFLLVAFSSCLFSQERSEPVPFKSGEWLRYKMSYSGFLKAGIAIMEVYEKELNGKKVYHGMGSGWTSKFINLFFKVNDKYQTYFDKETNQPYLFKRDVYEGGHIIKRNTTFRYSDNTAIVEDFRKDTIQYVKFNDVQDMISAFYYLRRQQTNALKPGDILTVNMFFDADTFPFRLKLLKREVIKTSFGKIKTLKFRPYVKSGRVFRANESVTIWISDDDNKIPIKMKADLSVGSLRAELNDFKGLANSFPIIFD